MSAALGYLAAFVALIALSLTAWMLVNRKDLSPAEKAGGRIMTRAAWIVAGLLCGLAYLTH